DLHARLREARPDFSPLAVQDLPTFLPLDDPRLGIAAPPPGGLPLLLGLEDEGGGPLWVDLDADAAHFIVAGPSGGGKTTLLTTMLLSTRGTPVRWYLAGSRRSAMQSLAAAGQCDAAASGIAELEELTTALDTLIDERREALHSRQNGAVPAAAPVL